MTIHTVSLRERIEQQTALIGQRRDQFGGNAAEWQREYYPLRAELDRLEFLMRYGATEEEATAALEQERRETAERQALCVHSDELRSYGDGNRYWCPDCGKTLTNAEVRIQAQFYRRG